MIKLGVGIWLMVTLLWLSMCAGESPADLPLSVAKINAGPLPPDKPTSLFAPQVITESIANPTRLATGGGASTGADAATFHPPRPTSSPILNHDHSYPAPEDDQELEETNLTAEPLQIGLSAEGRALLAHRIGRGKAHVIIVGGIHGGYEWNTILLANQILKYFKDKESGVPATITLHIIPNANPDGLFAVSGREGDFEPADIYSDSSPGRFNGNDVDLNRNWDCNWMPTALWRNIPVSAGNTPFSEPESRSLRDYILANSPDVVVFLHSAADAVYVSGCPEPHLASEELATVYARAADYPVFLLFDHYQITGDAGDWLTTQDIASFTVELVSHDAVEWEKNLAGILALLRFISDRQDTKMPSIGQYEYE